MGNKIEEIAGKYLDEDDEPKEPKVKPGGKTKLHDIAGKYLSEEAGDPTPAEVKSPESIEVEAKTEPPPPPNPNDNIKTIKDLVSYERPDDAPEPDTKVDEPRFKGYPKRYLYGFFGPGKPIVEEEEVLPEQDKMPIFPPEPTPYGRDDLSDAEWDRLNKAAERSLAESRYGTIRAPTTTETIGIRLKQAGRDTIDAFSESIFIRLPMSAVGWLESKIPDGKSYWEKRHPDLAKEMEYSVEDLYNEIEEKRKNRPGYITFTSDMLVFGTELWMTGGARGFLKGKLPAKFIPTPAIQRMITYGAQGMAMKLADQFAEKLVKGTEINLWDAVEEGALWSLMEGVPFAAKKTFRGGLRGAAAVTEKTIGQTKASRWVRQWLKNSEVRKQVTDHIKNSIGKGEVPGQARTFVEAIETVERAYYESTGKHFYLKELDAITETLLRNAKIRLPKKVKGEFKKMINMIKYAPQKIDDMPLPKEMTSLWKHNKPNEALAALLDPEKQIDTMFSVYREGNAVAPRGVLRMLKNTLWTTNQDVGLDMGNIGRLERHIGTAQWIAKHSPHANEIFRSHLKRTDDLAVESNALSVLLKDWHRSSRKAKNAALKIFRMEDESGVQWGISKLIKKGYSKDTIRAYNSMRGSYRYQLESDILAVRGIMQELEDAALKALRRGDRAAYDRHVKALEKALRTSEIYKGLREVGYVPHVRNHRFILRYKDPKAVTEAAQSVGGTKVDKNVDDVVKGFNTRGAAKNFMDDLDSKGLKYNNLELSTQFKDATEPMVNESAAIREIAKAFSFVDDETLQNKQVIDALQEAIETQIKTRGFRKHFIKRKNIPGWYENPKQLEDDMLNQLKGWVNSRVKAATARRYSKVLSRSEIVGEERIWIENFVSDDMRSADAIDTFNNVVGTSLYLKYLGFKLGIPIRDITQTMITGIPETSKALKIVSQKQGKKAGATLTKAMYSHSKAMMDWVGRRLSREEKEAMKHNFTTMYTLARDAMRTMDEAQGSRVKRLLKKVYNKYSAVAGLPQQIGESINRNPMYLSHYRIYRKAYGQTESMLLAADDVLAAHWLYSQMNKPEFLRSGKGRILQRVLYQFGDWVHNYAQNQRELIRKGRQVLATGEVIDKPMYIKEMFFGNMARLALGGTSSFYSYKGLNSMWRWFAGSKPPLERGVESIGSAAAKMFGLEEEPSSEVDRKMKALQEKNGGKPPFDNLPIKSEDSASVGMKYGIPALFTPLTFHTQIGAEPPVSPWNIVKGNLENTPLFSYISDIRKGADYWKQGDRLRAVEEAQPFGSLFSDVMETQRRFYENRTGSGKLLYERETLRPDVIDTWRESIINASGLTLFRDAREWTEGTSAMQFKNYFSDKRSSIFSQAKKLGSVFSEMKRLPDKSEWGFDERERYEEIRTNFLNGLMSVIDRAEDFNERYEDYKDDFNRGISGIDEIDGDKILSAVVRGSVTDVKKKINEVKQAIDSMKGDTDDSKSMQLHKFRRAIEKSLAEERDYPMPVR